MSTINEAAVLRFYLDTQEYSDRLTAIEAQAASALATQKSEVAAAIAQVNLTQSQTITALTLEVSNLKTDLTNSITATQTDLINRADQLAQDVTDITVQLTQDKATFTQEIQDALVYLQNESSVASALRTPRKIQGVAFDGTQDISLPTFTAETDGLVPKRVGAGTAKYLREDGTWVTPTNTTYTELAAATANDGTETTAKLISASVLKVAIQTHAPATTTITGNAGSATKLETARTISLTGDVTGSVSFDGSANASIATAITGLGVANGIATLDSSGQVPSAQLPSYVDDVLEYANLAAFPTTGETGKIYVETTGNTTYRWGGTAYVKITSGEVASVVGKTGVVTLSKADVGLSNVDNTSDTSKSVASASKLTTARTINGIDFDGTADINLDVYNKSEVDTAIANATPTIPNATETTAGKAEIATQVETYVATDDTRFVTPKKLLAGLKYHLNVAGVAPIFACRAWVNFNGVGAVAIRASGNVSSVTDNGVGDYTLNFAIPMPNANYSISSGSTEASDGTPAVLSLRMGVATPILKSISAVRISTRSPYTGILLDINNISVQVFC